MSYYPSIPQPTDLPSNSQSQILSNFGTLNTQFNVDHTAFTTGLGLHKQVTFNDNNAPSGVPSDPSSIIFTKNNAAGHPYPFFLNSQASTVASALPFLPDMIISGTNYGFKLGNMIFNFGISGLISSSTTITFAIPFTGGALRTAVTTPSNTSQSTSTVQDVTDTTMKIFSSSFVSVYYLAIGNV